MMEKFIESGVMKRILSKTILWVLILTLMSISSFAETESNDSLIIVSLGDSYSSGEGIEKFYGQDDDLADKVQNPDWLAHRSTHSWPGMLTLPSVDGIMAENRNVNWFFVATSGAETTNLLNPFTKEYIKGFHWGQYDIKPQLNIFDEIGQNETDYVTLTLGGNDVGFANIITKCVLGSTHLEFSNLTDVLNEVWIDFYKDGGTKAKLRNAYNNIAARAGDQAQIIVAGYPKLLEQNGKGWTISKYEAESVNSSVCAFNDVLENLVRSCSDSGTKISFVSVEDSFNGHEAYSEEPYINGLIPLAQSEDLRFAQIPSAYSIHPNIKGAQAYAKCVQAKIDELEASKAKAEQVNDLSENAEATESEIDAEAIHFSNVVLNPEDVVLKMFDALQEGNYDEAAECLDPAMEQQIDFWGGIVSTVAGVFTGENTSWSQLLLEVAGATDVEVIECYSDNLEYNSNIDLFAEWIPKIPFLKNIICTDADVFVKYRYKYDDQYRIENDVYHVRRYEWSGWRIETE
jgi:lysophospholipase L1-like esterase